jgi:hypothetical protein
MKTQARTPSNRFNSGILLAIFYYDRNWRINELKIFYNSISLSSSNNWYTVATKGSIFYRELCGQEAGYPPL